MTEPWLLGRYEIVAELGKGAMGVVYRAHDPMLNRILAIKTINTEEARSEEHTSELQSQSNLVCRLLLEKKNNEATSVCRTHPSSQQRQSSSICSTVRRVRKYDTLSVSFLVLCILFNQTAQLRSLHFTLL